MPPKLLQLVPIAAIAAIGVILRCFSEKGSDERQILFKLIAIALVILPLLALLGAGCLEPQSFDMSSITFTSEEESEVKDCGFGLTATSTRIYTVTRYPSGKTHRTLASLPSVSSMGWACITARSESGLRCVDIYQITATEKGTLALDRTTQETCRLNTETTKFEPINSLIQAE